MRRPLLLSAAFTVSAACSAQAVAINDSAVWHEEYWLYESLTAHHMRFTLRASGDTLINGLDYVKIRQVGVDSISQLGSTDPPMALLLDHTIAAIRADVPARKWYTVIEGDVQEQLLYDFDLAVGSTLSGTWGDCSAGITVNAIDSVMIAGNWHQRYQLDFQGRFLIEGVGASSGLFGYLCQFFEEFGCLHRFAVPDHELLVDGCGVLSTATHESHDPGPDAAPFPNPTTGVLCLPRVRAGAPITVHDQLGRAVLHLAADATGSVDLGALAPGTYVVTYGHMHHAIIKH